MGHPFAIVGAGKVGTALARLLADAGYPFVGAASRSAASAEAACRFVGSGLATTDAGLVARDAGLVFITTPDDAIRAVCEQLVAASALRPGTVVVHTSGALPSSELESARPLGAHVGSLHPLQTFAGVEQAVRLLPGSHCCIEGDREALPVLREVGTALGCHVMTIPTEAKPLYHAAAVVACNYLVALQNVALKLAGEAGLERAEALRALLPLVKGTVHNIESLGVPQSLTGPIARGDVQIVRTHLRAIECEAPHLLALYKVLGREAVEVALQKGTLAADRAARLRDLLR